MTKYHSRKTEINGIKFDSRLEADRYLQLAELKNAGKIRDLKLQPEFQIFQGWTDPETGERIKSRFYRGDFQYFEQKSGQAVVEDTKGVETADFRLKWDLVRSQYREFVFRKVRKEDM